jgi:hypothetical protein
LPESVLHTSSIHLHHLEFQIKIFKGTLLN